MYAENGCYKPIRAGTSPRGWTAVLRAAVESIAVAQALLEVFCSQIYFHALHVAIDPTRELRVCCGELYTVSSHTLSAKYTNPTLDVAILYSLFLLQTLTHEFFIY